MLFPVQGAGHGRDVWVLVFRRWAMWQHWPRPLKIQTISRKKIRKALPDSAKVVSGHALLRARERWLLPAEITDAEIEEEIRWILRHGLWHHEKDISRCTFGGRQVLLGFCREQPAMVVLTVYEAREDRPDFVHRFFQQKARRKGRLRRAG